MGVFETIGVDAYLLDLIKKTGGNIREFNELAAMLGISPDALGMMLKLKDSGLVTPGFLQDLFFGGGAGGGYPPAHADPRYWDLQYKQLAA